MAILKVPVSPDDHIQGNSTAGYTLVEYGDYQCPYCGKAFYIIKQVQEHFGKQLRFVFRNFPLTELHPHAQIAAEAAEFAASQGIFWEMHDLIYDNQENLSDETLLKLGRRLGLPLDNLETAIKDHAYKPKIKKDFLGGVQSGVNGTPTFFINGHRHDGAFDLEDLIAAIKNEGNQAVSA